MKKTVMLLIVISVLLSILLSITGSAEVSEHSCVDLKNADDKWNYIEVDVRYDGDLIDDLNFLWDQNDQCNLGISVAVGSSNSEKAKLCQPSFNGKSCSIESVCDFIAFPTMPKILKELGDLNLGVISSGQKADAEWTKLEGETETTFMVWTWVYSNEKKDVTLLFKHNEDLALYQWQKDKVPDLNYWYSMINHLDSEDNLLFLTDWDEYSDTFQSYTLYLRKGWNPILIVVDDDDGGNEHSLEYSSPKLSAEEGVYLFSNPMLGYDYKDQNCVWSYLLPSEKDKESDKEAPTRIGLCSNNFDCITADGKCVSFDEPNAKADYICGDNNNWIKCSSENANNKNAGEDYFCSNGFWKEINPEQCYNGIDDNGNGLIDKKDPKCQENCLNGADDDADGKVDCLDTDCWADEDCKDQLCEIDSEDKKVVWSYILPIQQQMMSSGDQPENSWQIGCCDQKQCAFNTDCKAADSVFNWSNTINKFLCEESGNIQSCDSSIKNTLNSNSNFFCDGSKWLEAEKNCSDGKANGGYSNQTDCQDLTCNGKAGNAKGNTCEYQKELTCNDGFNNDGDFEFIELGSLSKVNGYDFSKTLGEYAKNNPAVGFNINKDNAKDLGVMGLGTEAVNNIANECKFSPDCVAVHQGDISIISTPQHKILINHDKATQLPTNNGLRTKEAVKVDLAKAGDVIITVNKQKIDLTKQLVDVSKQQADLKLGHQQAVDKISPAQLNKISDKVDAVVQKVDVKAAGIANTKNKFVGQAMGQLPDISAIDFSQVYDAMSALSQDCFDSDCVNAKAVGPNGGICCKPSTTPASGSVCGTDRELHEVSCTGGVDDDLDGKVDCQDSDCEAKLCGGSSSWPKVCISGTCKDMPTPGNAPATQIQTINMYSYKDVIATLHKSTIVVGSGSCDTICAKEGKKCIIAQGGKKVCSEDGSTFCTCY